VFWRTGTLFRRGNWAMDRSWGREHVYYAP
jgi:hypothetical protein